MKISDFTNMSFSNLRRTKLRTFLTTSGVIVGIGALVSMVSFGTGMQKNVSDAMQKMDVFTSLEVMPSNLDIFDPTKSADSLKSEKAIAINDSVITWIASLPGVEVVYPEITVPVRVRLGEHAASTTARAVPMAMAKYAPYKQMEWGRFFSSDTAREMVASSSFLKRLKIDSPDSVIGHEFDVITAKMDFAKIRNMFDIMGIAAGDVMPFAEEATKMKLVGVWQNPGFSGHRISSVIIPMGVSKSMAYLNFRSVWDLLKNLGSQSGYPMVYVRLSHMRHMQEVQEKIESRGYKVWTIANQLDEIRRGFLIFDAALGAVGTIALFVAALGIINTMVMSVLERYREIGIMKAIGATDWDIKLLFFFESSAVGLIGGSLGIVLGWLVTRVANAVANIYIAKEGGPHTELFYIPWWLILGGIGFAIVVSLLAGLYPSSRAAKVDPVKALRHE